MNEWNEPQAWLDLDDCKLPYWRFGTGPDVVLVHGWPLDARTWRNLLPRLSAHFTCHLIDLPGAGRSQWDDQTPIGLEEHSRTLARAIDAMGLESCAVIAHDSGAVVARRWAAEHPERVRALVLGNTEIPGHTPWLIQLMMAAAKVPGAVKAWFSLLRFRPLRQSIFGFGSCFADARVGEGEFFDLFGVPLIEDAEVRRGQLQLAENLDFDVVHGLVQDHAKITVPVRFIWGVSDPYFPLAKARSMPEQCGGPADLVTIDPGKLFVHEEFPDLFLDHAEPILAQAFGSDSGLRAAS